MTHATNHLPQWADDLLLDGAEAGEDVGASLRLARHHGSDLPMPGAGQTNQRWDILAALAGINLTAARVFEAHTDALAILHEAGVTAPALSLGVFAAEAPGARVDAVAQGGRFRLSGRKAWCSLGAELDAALITAHVSGGRRLFLVDLTQSSVSAQPASGWAARGLRSVTSTSLTFADTVADPIGETDWYLTRPGFAWGGIGVAACWYGAAVSLKRRLVRGIRDRCDDFHALHVGVVDSVLHAASVVLRDAAAQIDGGDAVGARADLLALRTRAVVVDAVERTLTEVAHALGPAPLAFEEDHARRVADLQLYVRQHHAERDLAALGVAVLRDQP